MAMFGLFKKKEKPAPKQESTAGSSELRAFAERFTDEELSILAVTGPTPCACGRQEGEELYSVGITLTAWMDEDDGEVHPGEFRLVTKADETLQQFIAQRLPRDFIIKCKARPNPEGTAFLLTNLPEPAFDPELKALLEQQKAPVTLDTEDIGTFTLNRGMRLFQQEVDWADGSMVLCFDQNADAQACLATVRGILSDLEGWDARARERAADALLDKVNALALENDTDPLTREEFLSALVPDTLEAAADGTFRLWFNDDGLLGGSSVEITGSLTGGITDAAEV